MQLRSSGVSAGTPLTETAPASLDVEEPVDHTLRRRWLVLFVALVPLAVTWSLVNPMLASPDETIHILRAQSIAAGDFSNPFTSDGLPMDAIECLKFQPEVTADCQNLAWGPDGTQQIGPTDGYPPLYHSIAAVPALFFSGLAGAYLMRIWMAVIIMAAVAWAGAWSRGPGAGPWPLTGAVVAVTPMAIFTVATVNPSGMAVASALLFVVGAGSALDSRWRGRDVVAATVVGALGLALSRRDGLLWLGVLALVLAPFWIPQARQFWVATHRSNGLDRRRRRRGARGGRCRVGTADDQPVRAELAGRRRNLVVGSRPLPPGLPVTGGRCARMAGLADRRGGVVGGTRHRRLPRTHRRRVRQSARRRWPPRSASSGCWCRRS